MLRPIALLSCFAIVVAACSGAVQTELTAPSDGGASSGSSGGSSGSSSGASGSSSGSTGSSSGGSGGSSASSGSSSGGGSGGGSGGMTCAISPPDGGACNSLAVPTKSVTVACDASTPPTPTGGTIQDGVYLMTASTVYTSGGTCPAAELDHTEWVLCGASWQTAQDATTGGTTSTLNLNASASANGAQVTVDVSCGYPNGPVSFTFGLDANDTTFRLYLTNALGGTRVDTFTRQ